MKDSTKQKIKEILKTILPGVITLGINLFCYMVPKQIVPPERYVFLDMEIDRQIPMIPWFIIFYFLAFPQWANYYLQACFGNKKLRNIYFSGDIMAKFVIFFIFAVFWPLAADRPVIDNPQNIWEWVISVTFAVDNPLGCFPSLHCFYSWLSFRYSYDVEPKGRRWITWLQFALSMAVFASTVLVKQHYFIDIPGGIAFAEIFLQIARNTKAPDIFGRAMDKLTEKI